MNLKLFSKHNMWILSEIGIGSLERESPDTSISIMGGSLQAWLLQVLGIIWGRFYFSKKFQIITLLIMLLLMRWPLHKYKCLWGVEDKGQGSSLQEGASHTYT